MLPTENWLVPSMLAAGANEKVALVGIFCENEVCNSNGFFIPPAFYFSSFMFITIILQG